MKILNSLPPYNLFGIEEQSYESAKVVAVPIPYDSTTTYKSGTREGPRAIIEASRNIELFNEELNKDISKIGIYTTEEIAPDFSSPENMVKRICSEIKPILNDNKIPLLLGGEHTISLGSLMAIADKEDDFTLLHFDAHSDSRDSFSGSKYCHACIIARAHDFCNSYSVGVRSIDEQSAKRSKSILYMKDMHEMETSEIIKSIVKNTKKKIYLTVDLDVLDPTEMPSVGTPEPDGISFYQLKEIIKGITKEKKVIGMDFVELNPIPGFNAPNYLAAKLIYLSIGYSFKH
ncbi:MAG: agmatinase [Candidatus Micrarchaeaceae archaeon]|jgi:agmatinase